MQQEKQRKREYQKCVNVVVDHHPTFREDIDLKSLARISNFSPFYFHRIMKAFLGEPIGTFIVRTRTEAAHAYSATRIFRLLTSLPDWLRIPFFIIESVQAILWHFTFRI